MTKVGRMLVIDDDRDVAEFVSSSAQEMGVCCVTASSPENIMEMVTPDTTLIFLDLIMPEMDGVEVLRLLSERKCKAGIVLMSGIGERVMETAEKLAKTLGLFVVGHLQKPFRLAELEKVLNEYAERGLAPAPVHNLRIVVHDWELRRAIDRDQFVLHYQPQIDIESGAVAGLEALVRWEHPERGLIYPDSFISRIESMGLIVELGWLTVERGFAELSRFAGKDGAIPNLSVNITVHSLLDLKFPDHFVSLARKHGIPTTKVTVEITETGLIKELSRTLDVLTRLRMRDVHLSIDDFGTGYSMMKQLRIVPANELKIDMSFVQNMQVNASDRVMVQKTIEIGHELGLRVVAEGVETDEQLGFLRSQGCDIAQGYLNSRPLPPTEMQSWLEAYRSRMVQ